MGNKQSSPATQRDLRDMEGRIDAKLLQMERRIMGRFDLLTENLAHDFREANKDKQALHDDQLRKHAVRLDRLEKHAGFSA